MGNKTVVLGAGYAGATCASLLEKKTDVVWVSENDFHFVLHEAHRLVRAPSLEDELVVPVEEVAPDAAFVEARVEALRFDDRVIETSAGDVTYDTVVVAFGQRTADYGIDGVCEHGLTLKSREDAYRIHAAAERVPNGGRVVVAGGGLSGIQVAGELAEMFDGRTGKSPSVVVVEALDRIMPGSDDDLRAAIRRKMRKKGIVAHTGDPVEEATADEVRLESGETVEHDALVWTAGLAPRDVETSPPPERGARGALSVRPTLQVEGYDDAFAAGDAAHVVDAEGKDVPATAWAARQQAEVIAENVVRSIRDEPPKEYVMNDPGTLVSVGDARVGKVAGQVIDGVPARVLKRGAAVRHIAQTAGPKRGAKSALIDL
jgi:NADH dehydrogenase